VNEEALNGHIEYLLDYWEKAVDPNGGIHYLMDNFGKGPIVQDKKCLMIHARQLYNFSIGAEKNFKGSREIADHLYHSFSKIFPQHQDLYISYNISEFETEINSLCAYDLYFLVIGLARYARVTQSKSVLEEAFQLFNRINTFFDEENFTELGCYTNYDIQNQTKSLKSGNTFLHRLEACTNLLLAARSIGEDILSNFRNEISPEVDKIYALFENKIYSYDISSPLEGFDDDINMSREQEYGYITNAHPLEWLGFFLEASWLLEKEYKFLSGEAENMTRKVYERSLSESGCFGNNYYLKERRTVYSAGFWAQNEAILGFAFAQKQFNNQSYREWAEKMFDFHINHFVDREFGGIFSDVTDPNIVINRNKGYNMKCDYHGVRMCEKILEWRLL